MLKHILTLWSIATLSILSTLALSQCTSSILGSVPEVAGNLLTNNEKKRLDTELDSIYAMRDRLSSTAYAFQTEFNKQPQILAIARAQYQTAQKELNTLREHVIKRLEVGRSYNIPASAEKKFQKSGNEFINYYKSVSSGEKFGSALFVGIGFIYKWNDMLIAKQSAVKDHLNSQLTLDDWNDIKR